MMILFGNNDLSNNFESLYMIPMTPFDNDDSLTMMTLFDKNDSL